MRISRVLLFFVEFRYLPTWDPDRSGRVCATATPSWGAATGVPRPTGRGGAPAWTMDLPRSTQAAELHKQLDVQSQKAKVLAKVATSAPPQRGDKEIPQKIAGPEK